MRCDIRYVGKKRCGTPQYFCVTHKNFASYKDGEKKSECLCTYKRLFENALDLRKKKPSNIRIVYDNIFLDVKPKIFVDDKEFDGVFLYDDSVLCYKDLGGIMLSKLNDVFLEPMRCSHCNRYHSDNGKFAYTPHSTHLCNYCGRKFRVKEKNVGNEFSIIFDVPKIELENKMVNVKDECSIEYDLLKGEVFVNGESANKVYIDNEEVYLTRFLNKILENEF